MEKLGGLLMWQSTFLALLVLPPMLEQRARTSRRARRRWGKNRWAKEVEERHRASKTSPTATGLSPFCLCWRRRPFLLVLRDTRVRLSLSLPPLDHSGGAYIRSIGIAAAFCCSAAIWLPHPSSFPAPPTPSRKVTCSDIAAVPRRIASRATDRQLLLRAARPSHFWCTLL